MNERDGNRPNVLIHVVDNDESRRLLQIADNVYAGYEVIPVNVIAADMHRELSDIRENEVAVAENAVHDAEVTLQQGQHRRQGLNGEILQARIIGDALRDDAIEHKSEAILIADEYNAVGKYGLSRSSYELLSSETNADILIYRGIKKQVWSEPESPKPQVVRVGSKFSKYMRLARIYTNQMRRKYRQGK